MQELASLQNELAAAGKATSAIRKRRAYKNVARAGEDMLEASQAAPNRFRVLAIILESQRGLLSLQNSERNREALFETCGKLIEAPDAYADLRLAADMLLSERDLTQKNADLAQRTRALEEMLQRYRDTPGEAKSLMMAAMIAPKLEAHDLERAVIAAMGERFAGDPVVIGWRRENLGATRLDVLFTGTFKRADGASITFPIDRMGHTCVIYFWSRDTPNIQAHLASVKAMQSRFPAQLDVFSFNLDDLPDAGEQTLRALGIDWTVMHLPGGRQSQAYRAYATQDPLAVRVNAHGHAFVHPEFLKALVEETPLSQDLDGVRYLAQLQSLFIGDFLVIDLGGIDRSSSTAKSLPAETLGAIQACFTAAPMRYRQSQEQTLANYTKAEQLCREAIAQAPEAPELSPLRNRRIIALLGMWTLAMDPSHFEEAVRESRTALAANPPRGEAVVPRFCLAKNALRQGASDPQAVLSALIEATGASAAPASVYAAAAILAMDADDRDLHDEFREILLQKHKDNPALWPVVSFLRDQNHRYRLFKANYYLPPSRARRVVRSQLRSSAADLDAARDMGAPLQAEFITLSGEMLSLPQATDGKLTLLMFVEPPADPGTEFPTAINGAITEDSRGKQIETRGALQRAFQFAEQHVRQEIKVIAAFLSDDADRIQALMEKHQWPCQAVMVPGGLSNSLVRRLGILSADRVPNIVLLRPDGTIAWKLSGLVHPQLLSEGINELLHVIERAMKANIQVYAMENCLKALKQGDLEHAVRLLAGPFPAPERPNPDGWTAPRLHGRALAHTGLKKWEAALADIVAAIEAHQWVFNSKKPCKCQRVAALLSTKASILDQLGQQEEARAARQSAASVTKTHSTTRYELLHERLDALHGTKED